MSTYTFTALHDNSINCILHKRSDLLKYVQDRGAYDLGGYAEALDYWWTHGTHPRYVDIEQFMAEIVCPVVPKESAVVATPQQPEIEGLLGNKWVLAGGAALLLFLMFGRRRRF